MSTMSGNKQRITSSSTRSSKSKRGVIILGVADPEPKYHLPTTELQKPPPREWFGVSVYRTIGRMLGFQEPTSLVCLIIFGGALVGFCLARALMMNPAILRTKTVPGEWFWLSQPLYKPNIFLHIYLTTIGGILAVFQFLPVIRKNAILLHRMNGYFVLTLLIAGTVSGSIVGRRAFGGDLNVQSGFYVLGILVVFAAIMGYRNVKHTTRHRKWMLRCVTYVAVPITSRLTMMAARKIINRIGTYFSVWRCDQLVFTLRNNDAVAQSYPQCAPGASQQPLGKIQIAVLASLHGDRVNAASTVRATTGMALWIAILIHVIGIEFYLRLTDSRNRVRDGFVLGPYDDESE